ncbi:MAG: hypothetical protein L6R48_20500, partial [Planctomycetes bacterium]|nr:hypothetical protein [Planctomycetota bacterium]
PGVHPRAVFAFPATATVGGRMRSGPQPLAAETAGDGCRIALGTVDGALPVLLTGGCAPLLALDLPASAAAGAAVELAATCHNPGPAALTATLALLATGHNAEVAVTVPPWSATSVRLPLTAPAAGRLAVGAELRIAGGAAVRAIPVDLTVP